MTPKSIEISLERQAPHFIFLVADTMYIEEAIVGRRTGTRSERPYFVLSE
jgi:hypothetical protein